MTRSVLLATLLVMLDAGASHAATLRFVERVTGNATTLHGGTKADNVGDVLTFYNPVYDATNSRKLGFDQGYCVRLVVGQTYECHWTVSVAQGQLAVDGPFLDTGDSTLAVTGGTGAYSGARGEMLLHARDAKGSAYDYTFTLK